MSENYINKLKIFIKLQNIIILLKNILNNICNQLYNMMICYGAIVPYPQYNVLYYLLGYRYLFIFYLSYLQCDLYNYRKCLIMFQF